MGEKMNFVFNTRTPRGVHEAVGAYYSAILGMMKGLVTPKVSYDASVVILTGPRGYDISTMYEPYGKTPDVLSWFSKMVYQSKADLANRMLANPTASFEEDLQFLDTAHTNLRKILTWCINYLDPRTVFESVSRLELPVSSSFIEGTDWIALYKQLDNLFPQYITQANICVQTKFPDISTIFNEDFSSKMRTELILYIVSAGKTVFETPGDEPIIEVSKWLVRSLKISDEEASSPDFTPYILSKVNVSKLAGYLYRSLLSLGDIDETLARYRASLTKDSPESLIAQIETYCACVTTHKDALVSAIRAIIGKSSFSSITSDTFAFILSVRPPKNYVAYSVYIDVMTEFLRVYEHSIPSDNYPAVGLAAEALAGLMHFNALTEIMETIGSEYDVQALAGLRVSATRYFDGIVSQSLIVLGSVEEVAACKTFEDVIVFLDSKLTAANAAVSDIDEAEASMTPEQKMAADNAIAKDLAKDKVRTIQTLLDNAEVVKSSLVSSPILRSFNFEV